MINLVAAFRAVIGALESSHVDYVVVGSTAAAAWGVARTTRDVDLVAVMSPDDLEGLLALLDDDDLYVPVNDARHAARTAGSFNVLHTSSGGKVDVFVAPRTDAFTQSRLNRRVRLDILGMPAWVATPEDVVLAKLRWRRESRSTVQWRDCVEIVASQPLDRKYLSTWAATLEVADDLDELFAN